MKPIWYSFDELNAPTLNNAAGSLIAVFDAILVNGFNLKSVGGITISGGLATVSCTGHQFTTGRKVQIAGASISALNDNHDITVVDANTFTFPTTATGSVSGTITAKRPPLGWTKPFSGTNTAMYARTDVQATAMLLRVADTNATSGYARVMGVETATAADTYTAPFPLDAQLSGGFYVSKGANATAAQRWLAVGDGRTIYFFSDDANYTWGAYGGYHSFYFGDIDSWRSGGDPSACIIGGGAGTNGLSYALNSYLPSAATCAFLAKPVNQIGGSVAASTWGRGVGVPGNGSNSGGVYPSPVDNGMPLERSVLVREYSVTSEYPFRGQMRGLAHPMASMAQSVPVLQGFTGTVLGEWQGTTDKYLCAPFCGQGSPGMAMFNVSSEW